LLRWSVFRIRSAIGVPVVLPSKTPETISTLSSSLRWVTWRELGLDVGLRQGHAGRTAVDDAADRRAVALAEGRDAEQRAERAARHQLWFDEGSSSRLSTGQSRM
jgi:hypothetical protein